MKILVLSDSHRVINNTSKVFERLHKVIGIAVHLGDCLTDIDVFKKKYDRIQFYSVSGNCDFGMYGDDGLTISINSKKIFLTHGHRYNVKFDYQRLVYAAKEKEADVCLFGHTHQPVIFEKEGVVFMNPGSITFPRDKYGASYGIIDVDEDGKFNISIVEFDRKVIFQS